MPLLARILTAPLVVDVRRGAVADLGALLADRRIATEGRVAIAVGPGQGDSVLADLDPGEPRPGQGLPRRGRHGGQRGLARQATAGRGLRGRRGHRRRQDHRRDQVRRAHGRGPDGRGGHQPGARRHRLPGQLARARVGQGLLRGGPAGRGDRGPGPGALRTAPSGQSRDRGRGEQPVRHRGLGTGRGRPRRARRRAGRHAGQDRRPGGAAPAGHGRRRRVPHRAGRIPGAVRDRDDGGRIQPALQRRRPRDPARHRPAVPRRGHTTASWPASARCSAPTCAETSAWARSCPPAWPGTGCRGPPPTSGSATPSSPRRCCTRPRPGPAGTPSWSGSRSTSARSPGRWTTSSRPS